MDDPVLALFKTATSGCVDYFKTPGRWSDSFKEFLGLCLWRDPKKRSTAADLLKHPFLTKACSQKEMREVFQTVFLRDTLRNAGLDFL
jgi:serine/threonine protein kinase